MKDSTDETESSGDSTNEYSTNEYSKSFLNRVAARESTGCNIITQHNIRYMMQLMKEMREAIREERFEEYVVQFFKRQFQNGDYPKWAVVALKSVNIELEENLESEDQ